MFNKFKIGEIVLCIGIGKISDRRFSSKGKILEKDYYYKDYYVRLDDGTEEWFNERDVCKIKNK